MKKNKLWFLATFLSLGALSPKVYAFTCSTTTPTTSISSQILSVPLDLPVGSPIGNEIRSGSILAFKCSRTLFPGVSKQEFGVRGYQIGTSGQRPMINGRLVYNTNIAGIGYAVGLSEGGLTTCPKLPAFVDGTNHFDGLTDTRIVCTINELLTNSFWMGQFILQFYKTAETTGAGNISGKVGSLILRTNGRTVTNPEASVTLSSVRVNAIGCVINNKTITVPLGNVNKSMFKGPGTWPEDINTRSFVIPLSCQVGTRVNLKVDGDIQNPTQGILNISKVTGSASGIGVQVLFDNKPISLSTAIYTGEASSNGAYNIPLKARYYQTHKDIKAGIANASATFTLTYQ